MLHDPERCTFGVRGGGGWGGVDEGAGAAEEVEFGEPGGGVGGGVCGYVGEVGEEGGGLEGDGEVMLGMG